MHAKPFSKTKRRLMGALRISEEVMKNDNFITTEIKKNKTTKLEI